MATIIRESKAGLSTLIRQPESAPAPDRLIFLLHGWGSDGTDLMGLAPTLAETFPEAMYLAPDAPEPCSANPMGRQWFALDVDQASIDKGPDSALPMLVDLITVMMEETKLGFEQVYLVGFSQGGMMALHAGMRLPEAIGGVVSFSGALLAPDRLSDELTARPRVLLIHGEDDEVVPFQAMAIAKSVLKDNGIEAEAIARAGLGHGIDLEGIKQATDFINKSS